MDIFSPFYKDLLILGRSGRSQVYMLAVDILLTDGAQLALNRNCEKKFCW